MFVVQEIAAEYPAAVAFVLSLLGGGMADALVLLQRRGFGRGGFGRRRRPGGPFGALGTLVFLFVLGPIVMLALVAYLAYGAISGRRGR
jgi:hypothetical protein